MPPDAVACRSRYASTGYTSTHGRRRPLRAAQTRDAPTQPGRRPRIRVAIVGATGYVGGELVRLLAPPSATSGSSGSRDAAATTSRSNARIRTSRRPATVVDAALPDGRTRCSSALPHGAAAGMVPSSLDERTGGHRPRARLPPARRRPTIRAGTASSTRGRTCSRRRSTGCPSCTATSSPALGRRRASSARPAATRRPRILGPGAAGPRRAHRRPGGRRQERRLGRRTRARSPTSCTARSTRASRPTASDGHRHVAEMEQELGLLGSPDANPGAGRRLPAAPDPDDPRDPLRLPRSPDRARSRRPSWTSCTATPTRGEPFVEVADEPPATKHVLGSNLARIHVHADERTGRILRPRRHRQPRQGRRRPGGPGLQRRLRAAGDGGLSSCPLAP